MGILLNPDLEGRIAAKVQSGRYHSADEVIEEGLALLDERDAGSDEPKTADGASIAEMVLRLARQIPEEELAKLPADLAANHDHYLYGAPKRWE